MLIRRNWRSVMKDMKLRGMDSAMVCGSYPTSRQQPDEEPVVCHWTCLRTNIISVWHCQRGQLNGWYASSEAIVRGIRNWSGLNLWTLVSQPLTSHFLWPVIRTIWSEFTVCPQVFWNCRAYRTLLIASRESLGSILLALFRSLVICDLFHNLVRALCCSMMYYQLFLSSAWLNAARSLKFTECFVFFASIVSLRPSISASNALVLLALLSSVYILANLLVFCRMHHWS